MRYLMGVDTGGTFTDVVVIDEKGLITTGKALSTPPEFIKGVVDAIEVVAKELHGTIEELLKETTAFVFGTTVATNALATRLGSKTGLLTTLGFEDTLDIGRVMSKWAGLTRAEAKHFAATRKAEPLIPKDLIRGVVERIDWKGSVVCPLNREKLGEQIKDLAERGIESLAVCFLWSFRNPVHEQAVKEIVSKMYPELYISVSHEVAPTLGEYERFNTTVINAYTGPVTSKFVASVGKTLTDKGLKGDILIMKADGGCVYGRDALPISTVASGPAGGVISSRFIGEALGYNNIITTDVGGTSFDVSLVREGEVIYAREPIVERFHVSYPCIDVTCIGAGGGTIAWVHPVMKEIGVGPKSAGAYPGPACYGLGGVEPTVTDADLVLGYLNPDYFLGGRMKLYPDKAFEAVRKIGEQLGMDDVAVAAGIYDIVTAQMADLVRGVTVARGYDPRDFTIFAFGGAAPMHAPVYGADLGVKGVLVPLTAATFSAVGLAGVDILHMKSIVDYNPLPMDPDRFNKNLEGLEEKVVEALKADGIKEEDRAISYFLEMRYGLQYHEVRVPIPRKKYRAEDMDFIASEFDKTYEGIYGKGSGYAPAGRFVVSFIVQGLGRTLKPVLPKYEGKGPDASQALKGKRDVYFGVYKKYVSTNIYDYSKLQPANIIEGPAILEAPQTTVVIPPGQKGGVDEYLNILIK